MSKNGADLDPRVRRTRKMLREALVDLIPEKGYDAITVQDITDRATLNRSTFYLHYSDKDDLLARGFDEIWSELTAANPLPILEDGQLSLEGTLQTIASDFRHLAQHAELYRVMMGEQGVAQFIHRMRKHVYQSTEGRLRAVLGDLPQVSPPIEMALWFVASAYVGLMQWWLERGMPYAPEEMASLIVQLYDITPFNAMGLQTEPAES